MQADPMLLGNLKRTCLPPLSKDSVTLRGVHGSEVNTIVFSLSSQQQSRPLALTEPRPGLEWDYTINVYVFLHK